MRILLLFLMLLIVSIVQAATYKVTSAGTEDFTTISQANAFVFTSGDSLLFHCNESFTGTLRIKQSGVIVSKYGAGANPIITGFKTVSAWSDLGSNIWESTSAESSLLTCNIVVLDGVNTAMGRTPNSGWYTYQTYSTNVSITSTDINSSVTNWTGAELVVKKAHWVIDRNPITNHTGGTITYSDGSFYNGTANYGFFIQNDTRTLDVQNEWYYNPSTKKISIYSTSQPTNVMITTIDTLVSIKASYVTVENLTILGSNGNAIYISDDSDHITTSSCNISYSGYNAINVINSTYLTVDNCIINHSNNSAIETDATSYYLNVTGNTITNTGLILGQGGNASSKCLGIYARAGDSEITYNSIDSTGFNGITFMGDNVLVKNNFINNSDLLKSDGAGIYTYIGLISTINTNRKIVGNIVLNTKGNYDGTDGTDAQGYGIYLDGFSINVDVIDNTIAYCTNRGIYINGAQNILMRGNTVFGNGEQIDFHNWSGGNLMSGIDLKSNNIVSLYHQANMVFDALESDILSFGEADSNIYYNAFSDIPPVYFSNSSNTIYSVGIEPTGKPYTFEKWKDYFLQDVNSTQLSKLRFEYDTAFNGLNKYANETFTDNVSGITASNCTATRIADGGLDNGCLKMTNAGLSANAALQLNIGAVTSGQTYLIKYSVRSKESNSTMKANMIMAGSPYTQTTPEIMSYLDTSRIESQYILTPSYSSSNVNIRLRFSDSDSVVYIDNFQVYEVDTTMIDPSNYITLKYNATSEVLPIFFSSPQTDITGITKYASSAILQPFTSLVTIPDPNPETPPEGLFRPLIQSDGKSWGNYLTR